ncbi:MAG: DUF1841 family protein [Deltaproteobacteria bacterium]|nr:DUF1841 family protein [Deltaproteobacteria bacterium]
MTKQSKTLQLRLSLVDSEPEIWRRILVPDSYTLCDLHYVIQIAMGWENEHLHGFRQKNRTFGPKGPNSFDQDEDEDGVLINEVLIKTGSKFLYEYDFGDDWEHVVELEGILQAEPKTPLPFCVEGENACPPEDIGGVWRYNSIVEALGDSGDPTAREDIDEDLLEWLGSDFSPERFDLDEVNQRLAEWARYRDGTSELFEDEDEADTSVESYSEEREPEIEYDADRAPKKTKWRAVDELDKVLAVDIYHREARPHPAPQTPHHHSIIHVAVEEQILADEPPEVAKAMRRLMREGLSRHDTIHAIGSILYRMVLREGKEVQEPDIEAYAREVASLSATDWLAENQPDFTRKKSSNQQKKRSKNQPKKKPSRANKKR